VRRTGGDHELEFDRLNGTGLQQRTTLKTSRAIAVMAGGLSLAACSFAMPSMDFFSSKPTTAPLSIESNPPGADARISIGGTCRTPCSVSVPLGNEFSVTVALNGYTPETRMVRPVSAEASAGSPGATALLDPNPLFVELKPTAPPKPPPPPKKKRRRPIQAAAPAAEAPPPAAPPGFGPAPGGFGPPPGQIR
jgi:PEGA domain